MKEEGKPIGLLQCFRPMGIEDINLRRDWLTVIKESGIYGI